MTPDSFQPWRRTLLGGSLTAAAGLALGASRVGQAVAAVGAVAENRPAAVRRQSADVIVIGGGSAGAVMARRLSEHSDRKVLLLEAGHRYLPGQFPDVVASSAIVGAAGNPEFEWGYKSEPGYVGHAIGALRGKVLGGSSAINGGVALRARPEDFARWNLPGWSYQDMLPYFKRLEQHSGGATALHGHAGPLPVRQLGRDDITPMQRAFVDATLANGFEAMADFDGANAHGVGPYPMNIVDGVRINTAMAYLTAQVQARDNLRIRANVLVDTVLLQDNRAIGVRLADGEELFADNVIVSAGAYGSAAILLRSGIGPGDHLRRLDIPVVVEAPVGLNLMDHPFYYNAYAAVPDRIGAQTPVIGAKLWTRSSTASAGALDVHITATHLFPHAQSPTGLGFVLAVALTRPLSRGRVWLASRDPAVAPKIDLNFLAAPQDRERLLEAVKLARRIGRTAPLSGLIASELNPGPAAETDAAILASITATLDTYHHPVATAPMGAADDPVAVVDTEGRVHGVQGLRVVDASIFPDVPSVATNITTIAAAERIAATYT